MQRMISMVSMLGAVLIGCSQTSPNEAYTEIKVTGRGADANGEFCSDFSLDEAQVRQFFQQAEVLDASALHDRFDLLPCYVKGTAKLHGAAAEWTIRAGGTAEVHSASSLVLLGCETCEDGFGGTEDQ